MLRMLPSQQEKNLLVVMYNNKYNETLGNPYSIKYSYL